MLVLEIFILQVILAIREFFSCPNFGLRLSCLYKVLRCFDLFLRMMGDVEVLRAEHLTIALVCLYSWNTTLEYKKW